MAAGLRSRATGRRLDVDKATVKHGRPLVGPHGQHVIHDCCRTLPLHEGHLDALGTCIAKKAAYLTQLEQWAAVYGDAWGWMACSPLSKRGPAGVGDTRTWRHARRLVWQLQAATDGPIPCCASDAWPHAAEALRAVSGVWGTPPRQGTRGRLPNLRRCPPPAVCDAVVVNEREQGRVVHVMTRLVYGTTEPVAAAQQASPVRRVITTDGVERHHLPMRPHARRMGRQVQACSSAPDDLEPQRTLACADDHVVVPHRGLRDACPEACPPKAATARASSGSRSPRPWQPD